MFNRIHHQKIAQLLERLDVNLLAKTSCYFGGGTAIVLKLDEYRESVDVDFLCSSSEGYRTLRGIIFDHGFAGITTQQIAQLREVRADRYGIRTIVNIDDTPIKFEIVQEARIDLAGAIDIELGVPTLAREDMYAEKLLANTDRHLDRSVYSRDLIDMAMMIHHWGDIPDAAWSKARAAYGSSVDKALAQAIDMATDDAYLRLCLQKMQMDDSYLSIIQRALGIDSNRVRLRP